MSGSVRRGVAVLSVVALLSCLGLGRAAAEPKAPLPFDSTQLANSSPQMCADDCDSCPWLYDSASFDLDAQPASLTAREQALVRAAYAQYLSSEPCASDEVRLEPSAIGSKADGGRLLDVLAGSFSGKGRQQKLVLFFTGHCGQPGFHAENWGQRLLMLFERGRLVNTFVDGQTSLLRKVDVNADGIDEIVAWGAWTGMGGTSSWVRLLTLAGGVQLNLGDFGQLDMDGCGVEENASRTESTVRYRFEPAAGSLCFSVHERELACPAN